MSNGSRAAAAVIVAIIGMVGTAQAAEITIVTNQAAVSALRDIAPAYERATGTKVIVQFEIGPAFMQKIDTDAPADLASTFLAAFPDLVKRGKVVDGTAVEFARAGNG